MIYDYPPPLRASKYHVAYHCRMARKIIHPPPGPIPEADFLQSMGGTYEHIPQKWCLWKKLLESFSIDMCTYVVLYVGVDTLPVVETSSCSLSDIRPRRCVTVKCHRCYPARTRRSVEISYPVAFFFPGVLLSRSAYC